MGGKNSHVENIRETPNSSARCDQGSVAWYRWPTSSCSKGIKTGFA